MLVRISLGILIADALFQNNLRINENNAEIINSSTQCEDRVTNKQQHTVATYNTNSVFPT